jgi:PLP dependent protein
MSKMVNGILSGVTPVLNAPRLPALDAWRYSLFSRKLTRYVADMDLATNLAKVQQRIAAACVRSERDPHSVTLLAVTKGQPPETVSQAASLGLNLFGENKVQEAKAKIPLCPGHLRWHMIGHLQTNKCREAVGIFQMIQGVDSLHVAAEINRRAEQASRTVPILLEVNIVGEGSKFGYAPDRLLADLSAINALPRLEIHGLMTIPPWSPLPEKVRPVFQRLRDLKTECEQLLGAPLPQLSMGMSGDFEVAIEEGATIVRIGTALFGERPKPCEASI